ncbi:MAG TPA: glycosyltransferase family 4 protein [Acidobacteriaceae bacterium]|jgi:glycosyltransferase involved in cell wall biosynthesis|nr:glycosyltransferase family 4 protein [Acidobacteriaceae bacterium]
MPDKLRVALLINRIAPARIAIYSGLAREFELCIVQGARESNRTSWRGLDQEIPDAIVKEAWGWQLRLPRRAEGQIIDHQHIHIRPGIFWELLRFRPEVIIANEMGFRTVTALLYGMLFRVPVWVWWGGTAHTERNIGMARRALRFLITRLVSHWISYGKTSTKYLVSLKVPRSHIVEVQNSVDERPFTADPPAEFDLQPRPVVLCIGQLIARKGVVHFLQAAARLQKEGESFSILLVGDGPDKAAVERQIVDLGLENVHLHKSRRPELVPAVYKSADIVVFPTMEDVWGLVVNEAILSDRPVLCSRYAGCAEELVLAQSIFNPENQDEFTEKLRIALRGKLAGPDPSRLASTIENLERLVSAIQSSVSGERSGFSGEGSCRSNS